MTFNANFVFRTGGISTRLDASAYLTTQSSWTGFVILATIDTQKVGGADLRNRTVVILLAFSERSAHPAFRNALTIPFAEPRFTAVSNRTPHVG